MSDQSHVVVGGGVAGARAVEALRVAGESGRIVLVADEREHPYERPPLSKEYLAGKAARDTLPVHPPQWYDEHEVELLLGTRAVELDLAGRRLTLADGSALPYDRLLLATGSAPRKLRVPGTDLEGVHYLRRAGHADAVREAIAAGGPLVVVGGGWIGLEVAAVARQAGLQVTVLEAAAGLLGVLGPQVGERFAQLHRGHGVDVRTGVTVAELVGSGRVEGVRLSDGATIPAAAVLVGVGIRPLTELAEVAGLPVDDGVTVDATLRTADPAVWAAGDVANAENDWVGHRLRVEHFANADGQGPLAGRNMALAASADQATSADQAAAPTEATPGHWAEPPFFWTDQFELSMEYRGWHEPGATVVLRGAADAAQWFAFWLDASHAVQAAMHVNGWDDADTVASLVRGRVRVDPLALSDPGVAWDAVRAG